MKKRISGYTSLLVASMMLLTALSAPVALASTTGSKSSKTLSVKEQANVLRNQVGYPMKDGKMVVGTLAYYIPDKKLNPKGELDFVTSGYLSKDYEVFLAEAKKLEGLSLDILNKVPSDYKFKKAGISPSPSPEPSSDEYKKLLEQLKAQAAKGNKKVYSLLVPDSGVVKIDYTKGEVLLSLSLNALDPSKADSTENPGTDHNIKIVKIGDVEGKLITSNSKNPNIRSGSVNFSWRDESNSMGYTIWSINSQNEIMNLARLLIEGE